MKNFEMPTLEVIKFDKCDVIVTSDDDTCFGTHYIYSGNLKPDTNCIAGSEYGSTSQTFD